MKSLAFIAAVCIIAMSSLQKESFMKEITSFHSKCGAEMAVY